MSPDKRARNIPLPPWDGEKVQTFSIWRSWEGNQAHWRSCVILASFETYDTFQYLPKIMHPVSPYLSFPSFHHHMSELGGRICF